MSYLAEEEYADVIIPEGIVRICANAFANSDIASISLPCSLEIIETMAFAGCKNIKSMRFCSSIKNIEEGTFKGCEGMISVHFDDGGKNDLNWGQELFSMLNIETIDLPNNLKEIPYRTFYKCGRLQNIKIPSKLEALHNCIAHQDYTLQQRINFVENPGYLYYSNAGTFIPGTLENALRNEEPQTHFRNECLCRAMVDFNMIDTVSRGIKKMFNEQWRRHFPMPDYEIDQIKKKVVVRIYGNEINKRYTDLLKTNDKIGRAYV